MKLLGILAIIAASLGTATLEGGLNDIAKINRLKVQAEEAYEQEDYQSAVKYYTALVDSLQVDDDLIRLNLAHALIKAGDTTSAQRNYTSLANSNDHSLKSVAYQQLGIINSYQKKYKEALSTFKESLKADPSNEDARYDYELVKKLLAEQQQQEQEGEDQKQEQNEEEKNDQEQKNQEGEGEKSEEQQGEEQKSEQQQGEGEESEEPSDQNAEQSEQEEGQEGEEEAPPSVADKLQEMNITEEKARMILEAMRNNEMQYIQQNRRKPQNPRDRTKPDW